MRDLGRAPLVCHGVDVTPSRGNKPLMSAEIFPLDKVAHVVVSSKNSRE